MIKRRNFIKILPVGLLAAKFGGLVDLVLPKQKAIPVTIRYSGQFESKTFTQFMIPYVDEKGCWHLKSIPDCQISPGKS